MIASLMMYARPELDAVNARYWALIRAASADRGIEMPKTLSNSLPEFDVWLSPDLVFSQTCGLPYRVRLADHVTLIGTPDFGLTGCPAGHYNSAVVVRADEPCETAVEFRDARFVYNQDCSQSGYGAAYLWARNHGFWFADRRASGAHTQSARMVAEREADIAVLDAQTWKFIQRFDAFAGGLRVLDWTAPTPSLPYIAAKGTDERAMFEAVSEAISALDVRDRETLGLQGLVRFSHEDYMAVENPPF